MKLFDQLKGKEVIDDKGNKDGNISDIEWNPETNKVESLFVTERSRTFSSNWKGNKKNHTIRKNSLHRRQSNPQIMNPIKEE